MAGEMIARLRWEKKNFKIFTTKERPDQCILFDFLRKPTLIGTIFVWHNCKRMTARVQDDQFKIINGM